MYNVTRAYRIRTSLKIAYVRLKGMTRWLYREVDNGQAVYRSDSALDEESLSASIVVRLEDFSATFGIWRAVWRAAEPDLADWYCLWPREGATWDCVADLRRGILSPGIVTVGAVEDPEMPPEQQRRILDQIRQEVHALLPQFYRYFLACRHDRIHISLVAIRTEETSVHVQANAAMTRACEELHEWICLTWPECLTEPLPVIERMTPRFPTDPDDVRLLDAGLNEIDRFIAAEVNNNNTPKIILHKLIEQYPSGIPGYPGLGSLEAINNRVVELRKDYPLLVRPSRRQRPSAEAEC